MKKFFKISTAVLMVVLLLSLVGCPNGPEFDPSVGTWIQGIAKFFSSEDNDNVSVYVYQSSDTYAYLYIVYDEGYGFFPCVTYKKADAFASETWFNKAIIDGSQIKFDDPYFVTGNKHFSLWTEHFIPKTQFLSQLPSSGNWVVHMISDKDATRNIHFVIPAEEAAKVREWIKSK